MDEKGVEELAAQVGDVDLGDPIMRQLVAAALEANRTEEKRLKLFFAMHRFSREDDGMRNVAAGLEKVRGRIRYLEEMATKAAGKADGDELATDERP